MAGTIFDKIWDRHRVAERPDGAALLYVDRHYVQDVSATAFEMLRLRGLPVRAPQRTVAIPDHYVPTDGSTLAEVRDPEKRAMTEALARDAAEARIEHIAFGDPRQGIVHVVGPEQGLTQPGLLVVCGDSHTSTHGALGALAFGIGASEVAHVLATQSLWQLKPKAMRIAVDGVLPDGVGPKDLILSIIARIGTAGAVGHLIEYTGSTLAAMSMEGRFTVCNMSIEAGARAGIVAPDDTTFAYLEGRPHAPRGNAWDAALAGWRACVSDADAAFDREVTIDARTLAPMVTWGTSPEDAVPIDGVVPDPARASSPARRDAMTRALDYMGLAPGTALESVAVDRVFIGSCTNGRIEDLRAAAAVVQGRKVAPGVRAWIVPGSGLVKQQAEAEHLDRVFLEAGFEWRHPGCSMCLATNGDQVEPGERCASTSNRNFAGRQGPGARTHLMSPAMAAAAAVTGRLADVRKLARR